MVIPNSSKYSGKSRSLAQSLEHSSEMSARRYVEEIGSADMVVTKRLAGVTSEVNLGHHVAHTPPSRMNNIFIIFLPFSGFAEET